MIERKYLAHFIDASFADVHSDSNPGIPNYIRLGKDLEEFNEALNPQADAKFNILGEQTVRVTGYQPQSDVGTFFYEDYDNDALAKKLVSIANGRDLGDQLRTTMLDVLMKPVNGGIEQVWAYREDVMVVPQSLGGSTQGVQIPFQVYKDGNRTPGTFTASAGSGGVASYTFRAVGDPVILKSYTNTTLTNGKELKSADGSTATGSEVWASSGYVSIDTAYRGKTLKFYASGSTNTVNATVAFYSTTSGTFISSVPTVVSGDSSVGSVVIPSTAKSMILSVKIAEKGSWFANIVDTYTA